MEEVLCTEIDQYLFEQAACLECLLGDDVAWRGTYYSGFILRGIEDLTGRFEMYSGLRWEVRCCCGFLGRYSRYRNLKTFGESEERSLWSLAYMPRDRKQRLLVSYDFEIAYKVLCS